KACQHLKIPVVKTPGQLRSPYDRPYKPNEYRFAKDKIALQDISTELVFLPSETNQQINLAWKVNIYTTDAKDWWNVFVDAKTGDIITKSNQVVSCSFQPPSETDSTTAYKNTLGYSPDAANDFNVIDRPAQAPSFASRTIINSPWNLAGAAASPFG